MKGISVFTVLFSLGWLVSCRSGKITTTQFQNINYKVVAEGNSSKPQQKLLLVTYNKYLNQEYFGTDFIQENHLDTVSYRKNMLIEIFLGQKPETGYTIAIDKIEENKHLIRVYYSVNEPDNSESSEPSQPYIIIQTHKSRKPVQFFENEPEDIYVN